MPCPLLQPTHSRLCKPSPSWRKFDGFDSVSGLPIAAGADGGVVSGWDGSWNKWPHHRGGC